MKALHRKALRDLWHMRSQALAIALVIAAGIALLVMTQATLHSLRATRDQLYADYRFSDVWATVKRAPLSVARQAADIPGVNAVETRLIAAAKLELPGFDGLAEATVQSLPDQGMPQQNRLYLRAGRMLAPFDVNEVLISESFALAHKITPGERLRATIYGRTQWFTIVGVAVSPEYLYQVKPGALFPDYERYAIVWMNRRALEAALDMSGAFNQLTLALSPEANTGDVLAALDRLLERYGGRGAQDRMNQMSYRFLFEEFRQLESMVRIFPTIFLGVAAFLLNVVFTRLIGMQRDQIAILKAFGYRTVDVAAHYALIVLLISLLGGVLGVAAGVWMGNGLAAMYQQNYRFPYLRFSLDAPVVLAGMAVCVLAALAGAGRAVWRAAGESVADAMRPPAPEHFRRTLAERLGLARWLSPPTRIILRQIERRPVKALMSVLGLAFAGAILLTARFQDGSINHMIEVQYRLSQQHDIAATFIEAVPRRAAHELRALDGVQMAEGYRSVAVRLRHENHHYQTSIEGLPPDSQLRRPVDENLRRVRLPDDGLVLNDYLANRLGVRVGDTLWVEVLEGRQTRLQLPVVQLVRDDMGTQSYMNLNALNRALGDGDVISGARLTVADGQEAAVMRQLDRRPGVAGAELRLSSVKALYRLIDEMMGVFTLAMLLMAGIINFGVVYNSARIALSERGRELASLRVLGFTQGEVSYILLGELALLVLVSIPVGLAIGYALAWITAVNMATDIYRIPLAIPTSAYAYTALVTLASAAVSALAVYWRIRRLDLIGVLKTRE